MSEINTTTAAEIVAGRNRIPGDVVIDALGSNNTELKVLVQAPLIAETDVPLRAVKSYLKDACNGNELQPLTSANIISVLRAMNPRFVEVHKTGTQLSAVQSQEGRVISAALGGHLLNLAVGTNIPLRGLIGESLKSKQLPGAVTTMGSIETRLNVLCSLWQLANNDWTPAADLLEGAKERGVAERITRSHVAKLIDHGVVEKRTPARRIPGSTGSNGYLYRIKQENGHVPPTEIVDRFLGIVLLSSVLDPDFIREGLGHLEDISQNPKYVPFLLKRSFLHTGHTGKNAVEEES